MTSTMAAWLGPRSKSFDILRIWTVAAAVAFFYLYFGNLGIENDARLDMEWAEAILGNGNIHGNTAFYLTEAGMPLIVLASGYTFTHSLVGLVIIQTLMAIALPVLLYLTLRPWFPKTAYFTALASTISLAPFLLMKLINHDEPYLFFMMLSLYLLNRYVWLKTPSDLYSMTFVTILMSLIRQAGRVTFPFLMLACLIEGPRKNYKHLLTSVLIFTVANIGYLHYRRVMLGDLPFLGLQAFQNVYMDSAEFGVRLSPEFGPDVKLFIDSAHQCSLPSPAQGPIRQLLPPGSMGDDDVSKYTTDELQRKFFATPNFTYYFALADCLKGDLPYRDHVLLMAALETARARPLLILDYVARSVWQLLFDPGWLHAQHTTAPILRGGMLFPFGGETTGGRGTVANDRLADLANREALFIPIVRQPGFLQRIYFGIEDAWARTYHPIGIALGIFTCITWLSTAIGLLSRILRRPGMTGCCKLFLADLVVPASLGASMFLITNIATTAIFVDPLYRYDQSLLMLKFTLAGIGCAIVVNLCRAVVRPLAAYRLTGKSSASLRQTT